MNCKEIQDLLLTDYTDGMADKSLCEKIDKHLDSCEDCRQFYQIIKLTADPIKNSVHVLPPERIWHNIQHKIEEQKISDRKFFIFRKLPVYVLFSAAVFLLIFLNLYPKTSQTMLTNELCADDEYSFVLAYVSGVDDNSFAVYEESLVLPEDEIL